MNMADFLFLRPPGPGAIVRFAERLAPEAPACVELRIGDSRTKPPWRIVYAGHRDLDPWLPCWSHAFGPRMYLLRVVDQTWVWETWADGALQQRLDGPLERSVPWWMRLPGVPPPPPVWWDAAPEPSLPLGGVISPPRKVVDFATVDTLDQRSLLVEPDPVVYRVLIPTAPTV